MGQIMQVGFSFAPKGWATCSGQIISISQSTALFSLLGTIYGGNGQSTFQLPNAGGRALIGTGQSPGTSNYALGQISGTENVTLTTQQMPMHNHNAIFVPSGGVTPQVQAMSGIAYGTETAQPTDGCFLGTVSEPDTSPRLFVPAGTTGGTAVNIGGVSMSGAFGGAVNVAINGGSQPFGIMQPYLAITTIIAMQGMFPSRN
ncbi:tail fiber protein [Sphingomonas sp. KR3-1]|uniref:phage tail protein n=1 Tax=Sphingomonas sp. KR3-1 TaxID=3156611 RepID=UPI0032B4A35D